MAATSRTLAFADRILTALRDGPGTGNEIARRIGCMACECLLANRVGLSPRGAECRGCEHRPLHVEAGWRPCMGSDVYRQLRSFETAGLVAGVRDPERREVVWSLVDPRAELERQARAIFEADENAP